MASGDVSPSKLPGPPKTKITEENIDTVGNLVEEKPNSSISEVLTTMNVSTGTLSKSLRKTLRKYLYKPKPVQCFTLPQSPVKTLYNNYNAFYYLGSDYIKW